MPDLQSFQSHNRHLRAASRDLVVQLLEGAQLWLIVGMILSLILLDKTRTTPPWKVLGAFMQVSGLAEIQGCIEFQLCRTVYMSYLTLEREGPFPTQMRIAGQERPIA